MASDWIKMRIGLEDDPAVISIARAVKLEPDHVCGKLLTLWGWADLNTVDGRLNGVDAAWIDGKVRKRGFAQAMAAIDPPWLLIDDEGVTIPNFDRHNGKSAKSRAENSDRQRVSRKTRDNCVTDVAQNARQTRDQRREEKNKEYPPPPTPSGAEPVSRWQEEEGAIGVALRRRGVSASSQCIAAAKAAGHSPEHIRAIIEAFDAQKGAWGAGALYKRIVGELGDWPEPSREFLAAQARDTASRRANELHDVHEAQRREAAESAQRKAELEKLFGPKVDSLTVEQQRQLLREHCDEAEAKSLLPFVKKNRVGSLARERLLEIAAMLEQEAVA